MTYRKSAHPPEAALVEAAGLRWLKEADTGGGPAVVEVISAQPGMLELEHVGTGASAPNAAADFGAALARMHRSLPDDALFGELPQEHPESVPPLFGPAEALLEMGAGTHESWGAFHAAERLNPVLEQLRPQISAAQWDTLGAARDRIATGAFDDAETPSRLHGDLWSGNVLWGPEGVVLIDPAAHAGHRESDLALLQLFDVPHWETILAAYQEAAPLREGWEERVPVHQLFFLAAHWLLFGSSYAGSTLRAAQRTLDL